jgi:predicted alpha/beta superfamily hydrolase
MKNYLIISMLLCSQILLGQNKNPIVVGETVEIYSESLKETRTLNIYLPFDYQQKDTTSYAVVYLLDGGKEEDFLHIAGIIQFLSFPWIGILPPTILVGVANVDRKRDFTFPTTIRIDKEDFPTSGGSKKFIEFMKDELQPYIREEYRGINIQTIIGQSLGGLVAAEILLKFPDVFDKYIIVSPSLWWDQQSLLDIPLLTQVQEKSIFVAVGKEGEIMEGDAKSLYNKLSHNENVYFQFLESQNHGDALHLAVYSAFEKIFKKKQKVE